MLAAKNGHKDVVFILTQKGANLDLVNEVSVHVHMLYEKISITEEKLQILFIKDIYWIFYYHIFKKNRIVM